jgi:ubiquinone/menaquinone biosynthesis C-methylase UbiE
MLARLFGHLFGSPGATRFYFDRIGLPYLWTTNNPLWRDSLREVARHFPPGGAELKVLDLGCGPGNSALQLLEYRQDLRVLGVDFSIGILRFAQRASLKANCQGQTAWVQADVAYLPIADNSFDVVTAHSVYYRIEDRAAFLRETLRVLRPGGRLILLNPIERPFAFNWLLKWQKASRVRFSIKEMAEHLTGAGFARVLSEWAAEGYGVLSRGEKPYPNLSTVERIAKTAALDETGDETGTSGAFQLLTAEELSTSRGRFVFLLVRQKPDKPAWAIKPGEPIHWQAAVVNDLAGKPYLVAFSSLAKAVEFMQPAVTSGYLVGINKVAKFDKVIAPQWGIDLLFNPAFEALQKSDELRFQGNFLTVDPENAVIGEE